MLRIAKQFFLTEEVWGDREYSIEAMYPKMKELVRPEKWNEHVEELIRECTKRRDEYRLLFIYEREKMWDAYMNYIRKHPSCYIIDDSPEDVKELYPNEIISLYSDAVRDFFSKASGRNEYCEGVALLRNLIGYGGKRKADKIIAEQKARKPRRPALIDELSKL